MRLSLATWVIVACVATVLVLGGVAVVQYRGVERLIETAQANALTHDILAEADDILGELKELDAAQNSFLVTNDEDELAPFLDAPDAIEERIVRLRSRVVDSPRLYRQIEDLEKHVAVRNRAAEQAVDARRAQPDDASFEAVRATTSVAAIRQSMVLARQVVADLHRDGATLLRERRAESDNHVWWTRVALIGGNTLALGFIGLAIFGLQIERGRRRHAEERIVEQNALLDQVRDAILVHDMDGRITYWNQGAEQLYRWTSAEVYGADADRLLCDPYGADHADARYITTKAGSWSGQVRHATKGGKEVFVEQRRTLIHDQAGRPKAQLVINIDVTDKLREEAQRRRSQRLESLGTLAGGVAHDLNNVLTPILVGAKLLRRQLQPAERDELLTTLHTSAERGAQIVRQLVSFAGGTPGSRTPVHIDAILGEVLDILRHTFPKTVEVRSQVASDVWPVLGDATELSQVLMNLCINARDAMPDGGALTITAENFACDGADPAAPPGLKHGFYVRLVVTDSGVGIPEDVIDKIFDPFFTTKEKGKGTGLGLATTLGIIHGHGGEILVHSTVGEGTEFSLYLPPASDEARRETPGETTEPPEGQGETILVIDDEAPIRSTVRRMLEAHGYYVVTAGGGREALDVWQQLPDALFHAALVDMMMPDMDGPDTIRAIRQLDERIPVVATSGLRAAESGASEAGADAFLPKPYTEEQLLRILRRTMDATPTRDESAPATEQIPVS